MALTKKNPPVDIIRTLLVIYQEPSNPGADDATGYMDVNPDDENDF